MGNEIVNLMKRIAVVVCLGGVTCLAGTLMGQDAGTAQSPALALSPSVALRVEGAADARGAVTLVSVHQKTAAPADVFANLGKQAGVRFVAWPDGLWDRHPVKQFTLDADRQPFWVVALQAADACGLSIRRTVGGDGQTTVELHTAKEGAIPLPMSGSGPLAIVAESIRQQGKGDPGDGHSGLLLGLRVYADPSLKNYRFIDVPTLDEATDDQGHSLIPPKGDKATLAPSAALVTLHEALLAYPAQPGKRIATVRGSMALLVASECEDFVIDPALKNAATRQIGKFTYAYQGLERKGQGYELMLGVKGPAEEMSVAVRDLIVSPQSILPTDAAGNRYGIGTIAATFSAKNVTGVGNALYSVVLQAQKADAGDIATITWRLPRQISTQEIRFEFHDLPMP